MSIHWIIENARKFQENIYLCFDCVDLNKLWESLQEMGITDHLTCLLRNLCVKQEVTVNTVNTDMEQLTGSNLKKEYIKSVYRYPASLTYMQRTACEIPGCKNHKLESRFPREYQYPL